MFRWESNLSEEERIAKNVINLLNTRKNEVCFDRNIGLSIDYLDKSVDKISSDMITEIIDMIEEKEPRANLSIEDIYNISQSGDYELKAVISSV
jgi:phage baseplate assembly protein W